MCRLAAAICRLAAAMCSFAAAMCTFAAAMWWFFGDYRVSPNFFVVLGLRLWLRLGLGCDNFVTPGPLYTKNFSEFSC